MVLLRRLFSTRARGQALVEFALVIPILALLLVMAIDFGRVFFEVVALQNAARIGADYAASHADAWNGPPSGDEMNEQAHYQALVLGDLQGHTCVLDPLQDPVFSSFDDGALAYVRLDCKFGLVTPLAEQVLGGPAAISARADFAVNRTINPNLPESSIPPPNLCSGPEADFATDPGTSAPGTNTVHINAGDEVAFTDTSTFEGGCDITLSWDFDDGPPIADSADPTPSHVFADPGTFTVTLTVTNAGGSDTATVTVDVE